MMNKLDELAKMMSELKDENAQLEETAKKQDKDIKEVKEENKDIKDTLKDAGVYDKAKVKKWF